MSCFSALLFLGSISLCMTRATIKMRLVSGTTAISRRRRFSKWCFIITWFIRLWGSSQEQCMTYMTIEWLVECQLLHASLDVMCTYQLENVTPLHREDIYNTDDHHRNDYKVQHIPEDVHHAADSINWGRWMVLIGESFMFWWRISRWSTFRLRISPTVSNKSILWSSRTSNILSRGDLIRHDTQGVNSVIKLTYWWKRRLPCNLLTDSSLLRMSMTIGIRGICLGKELSFHVFQVNYHYSPLFCST